MQSKTYFLPLIVAMHLNYAQINSCTTGITCKKVFVTDNIRRLLRASAARAESALNKASRQSCQL